MELISSIVVEMMFCPVLAVICENVDNELFIDIPYCELYGFHTVTLGSVVAAMAVESIIVASAGGVVSTVGAAVVAELIVIVVVV